METAGVKIPPPLIHISFILIGGILQFLWPVTLNDNKNILRVVGVIFIAVALSIISSAVQYFAKAKTNLEPWKPTTAIVTSGPYRFSRNPMYLSFALIHGGITLIAGSAWILCGLVPALLIMRYYVIAHEEGYLAQKFGGDYMAYKKRIPRWF